MHTHATLSIADTDVAIAPNLRLAYTQRGATGLPLVCLHAVSHGSRDFAPLLARLDGGRRVLALDWPDHGRSDADTEPTSAARYEAVLAATLDTLGLERVILLGNSIGGAAAIRYAARHPARVHALVVCDSGGLIAPNAAVRAFCHGMAWAYRRGAAGARWFDAFYRLQYRMLLPGAAVREQRARIVAAGRTMAPVLAEAWRSFAAPDADIRALVPQVRSPVLLAWARRDPYNAYRAARSALAGFAGAETTLFDGGHAPFLEQPDAFATTLHAFLDAHDASTVLDGRDRRTDVVIVRDLDHEIVAPRRIPA
jgi:4,5:9,10-diseco-3-hydroxy-5,9,17-trioxoandrosta-1(10),2-diene-4-oate hydrolase